MLLASKAECSFRYADSRTNFDQMKRLVRICIQEFFEPRDDDIVATTSGGQLRGFPLSQAPDHHVDQFLFQCSNYFGKLKQIGSRFGDLSDHPMKLQQPRHQGTTWPNEMLQRRF